MEMRSLLGAVCQRYVCVIQPFDSEELDGRQVVVGLRSVCASVVGLLVLYQPAGAQQIAAPVAFKSDFSTVVSPTANIGRFYYYPVQSNAVVCGAQPFAIGDFSRPGCLAWFDEQSWNPLGPGGLGYLHSKSPWWTDANHRIPTPPYNSIGLPNPNPGLGYINVIAFVQPPPTIYTPLNLVDGTLSFRVRKDSDFIPRVADSRVGPRQGHLYVWFQTSSRLLDPSVCTPNPDDGEDCTRQTDYILSDHALSNPSFQLDTNIPPNVWSLDVARLLPIDDYWTCLGRGDNVKYECEPIASALTHVQYVGFIVAPVCTAPVPDTPGAVYICGDGRPFGFANWSSWFSLAAGSNGGAIDLDDVVLSTPTVESAAWFSFPGLSVGRAGNDISKPVTAIDAWNAMAASSQVVTGGSVAVDFAAGDSVSGKVVGLSRQGDSGRPEAIDFGIYLDGSGAFYTYESGVAFGFQPPNDKYTVSDVFRVRLSDSASGRAPSYYRNGNLLPDRPRPNGMPPVVFPVEVSVAAFTPGAQVQNVALSSDGAHRAMNVTWQQLNANATVTGHVISHSGDAGAPGEAVSSGSIGAAGGFVDALAGETSTYKILGLSSAGVPTGYAGIGFGIYLYAGTVFVFESGTHRFTLPGTYSPSDRFRVAVDATGPAPVVKYFKNYLDGSQPFFVSQVAPTFPLFANATLYSAEATLPNAIISPTVEQPKWAPGASAQSTTPGPGDADNPSEGLCASSVVATRAIGSGDGFFEVTSPDNTSDKRIGLTRTFVDGYVSRIDFQLYLPDTSSSDKDVFVKEYLNGSPLTGYISVVPYVAGDRFRVGVEGRKVTYRRNGQLLYQDTTELDGSSYPLYFTFCAIDGTAAVTNVLAGGADLIDSGF
jgi:hypothetical protein